jgi:hypothetical protein
LIPSRQGLCRNSKRRSNSACHAGPAAILNQNPIFEMPSSKAIKRHPSKLNSRGWKPLPQKTDHFHTVGAASIREEKNASKENQFPFGCLMNSLLTLRMFRRIWSRAFFLSIFPLHNFGKNKVQIFGFHTEVQNYKNPARLQNTEKRDDGFV